MPQSLKERYQSTYENYLTESELDKLSRIELSDRKTDKGEYVFYVRSEDDMKEILNSRRLLDCLRETAEYLNDSRTIIYRHGRSGEKRVEDKTRAKETDSMSSTYKTRRGESEIQTATIGIETSNIVMRVSREQIMINAAAIKCAMAKKQRCVIPFSELERNESNYKRIRREASKAETAETEVTINIRHRDGRMTTTKTTLTIIRSIGEKTEGGRKYLVIEPTFKTREIMSGKGDLAKLKKPLSNITHPLLPLLTGKARSLLLAVLSGNPEGIKGDPDRIKEILGETAEYRDWSDYKKRLIAGPAKEIEEKSGGRYGIEFKATRVKGLRYEALPVEIEIRRAGTI